MGPHTKSDLKTASPTLPARHATQTHFFLNLTLDIETLGGYLAFPIWSKLSIMWWWLNRGSKTVYWPLRSCARLRWCAAINYKQQWASAQLIVNSWFGTPKVVFGF